MVVPKVYSYSPQYVTFLCFGSSFIFWHNLDLVRAQGGEAVEADKRFVPETCNNTDVVVDWLGGRHDTLHAPFGLRANIDPAVYKVMF